MFQFILRGAAALFCLLWLAAPLASPASAQDDPLKVTASFSILQDIVANVGGDAVEVSSIVPAGGDAHTFDPAPDQIAAVAEADVVFAIGLDFEPWLDDVISSSGTGADVVTVSDGLELITSDGEHDHEDETEEEHAEHADEAEEERDHGATDPHVWGDVQNVIAIVATVEEALAAADPENADTYEANAAAYTAELEALDAWVAEQVATLPEEHRKLVTSHDTFAYYARAYGFEIVGTAIASVSTESGDPSAEEIATLVQQIQETGVPAIFTENVSNPDLIEQIATEAGVVVGPPLYTDALGEPGTDGDTYIKAIEWNTTSIVTALAGPSS
jgi:ABC-type Zn uptake system ZnuABC Zn-binding protein ZnuA